MLAEEEEEETLKCKDVLLIIQDTFFLKLSHPSWLKNEQTIF
jgi:hypothetical protein